MKRICIITPGTIASNPRLVKEAEALSEDGHIVHLIYTRHVDYLTERDQEILDNHPAWTYDYLDWSGKSLKSKSFKVISGLKRRAANLILRSGFYPAKSEQILLNRFYLWQLKKAISWKADLYIAHYPDSIAIAAKAAKINYALFAFDAEDFHRGEDIPKELREAISTLEDRFLPAAAYISAASPLIAQAYQDLFPGVKIITLQNMFQLKSQPIFVELDDILFKFFWFSQTIGPKRGLEEFISILKLTQRGNVQMTLLGNCTEDYKTHLQEIWLMAGLKPSLLRFVMTLPEKDIFKLAGEHHFGLGLEIPYSLNRDICLTNKIFSYILSGNLLILSKTSAQTNFHKSYPESGICIDLNDPKKSALELLKLMADPKALNAKRKGNYESGRSTLNFDREKHTLLKEITSILG